MDKTELYERDVTGMEWNKSSASDMWEKECVEVAVFSDGAVAIRDSREPARPDLRFTAAEWAAFTTGVRNSEF
ncbi:MAG TPA: DUF397 domain-containing protein [Pseudonocardiaceae bacterium]